MTAPLRAAAAVIAMLGPVASAHAFSSPTPWNGVNPFKCTIQDAGKGTVVPDPNADPYCVNFDKTGQNVTELGLVDFLSKEPARVAAAGPKCFYYQQDHWRGSLIQSNGQTVLYEYYGHYVFNKATGDGGVYVHGFSIAGQTFDPTTLPGFPPGYGQYFGPGTGGAITHNEVPADPSCAAKVSQTPSSVYAANSNVQRCVATPGSVGAKHLGPVTISESESQVRAALGPPASVKRGYLHYCAVGGFKLFVGQAGDRSGSLGAGGTAPTVILVTTSHHFPLAGRGHQTVVVGSMGAAVKRAFPHAHRLFRTGRTVAYRVGAGTTIVGIRAHQVRYIAVYDAKAIRSLRALADYVRRA